MSLAIGLAVAAGTLSLLGYLPYARDILHHKVCPARSSRLMLTLLVLLAVGQQYSLHAGLIIAVTVGEAVGSLVILVIGLRQGSGGWQRTDQVCYGLLAVDVTLWAITGNAFVAIILNIIADVVAFFPTLYKTWRDPHSETALFYVTGVAAPLINLGASAHLTVSTLLYPLALALENAIEVGLIRRRHSLSSAQK